MDTLEKIATRIAVGVPILDPAIELIVVDDEGTKQPLVSLPDVLPEWAMPLPDHRESISRTADYHCTDPACNGEHDEYRTNPRDLPYAKLCGCAVELPDGSLSKCTAVAIRRTSFPGEFVAVNARRFEPLAIFERANYDSRSDDYKRGHDRYYIPGRNNEPTEPGMKRIEITNIHDYNRVSKEINQYETQKMRDHRSMHEAYFGARRKAMREDVDARVGPQRSHPLISYLRYAMRKRSDNKFNARYGKPLDAHFHAQLIEYNQSNMQPWTAEDTGWKDRRAR